MTTIRNKKWQMRNGNQVLRDVTQAAVAIVYPNHMLGYVREGKEWLGEPAGWMAETDEGVPVSGLPDRNTACVKACELLGYSGGFAGCRMKPRPWAPWLVVWRL